MPYILLCTGKRYSLAVRFNTSSPLLYRLFFCVCFPIYFVLPVLLNLGVVNNIVMGYLKAMSADSNTMEVTATDLMQEATMGLIRAVEK